MLNFNGNLGEDILGTLRLPVCHHVYLEVIKNFVLGTLFFKNGDFMGHKDGGWPLLFKILAVWKGKFPEMFRRKVIPRKEDDSINGSEDGMA